jgi:hypothetical protein
VTATNPGDHRYGGLSAGFMGYFKYHERSFNLQQTAYSLFADTVERMRDEENKRQQKLDQPVEVKRPD